MIINLNNYFLLTYEGLLMKKYLFYGVGILLIVIGVYLTQNNPLGGWELVLSVIGFILVGKGWQNNEKN